MHRLTLHHDKYLYLLQAEHCIFSGHKESTGQFGAVFSESSQSVMAVVREV